MLDLKVLETEWIKKGALIDWQKNIPKIIKFSLNEKEDYINLIGYNKEKNLIILQYLDDEPFEIEGFKFIKGWFYQKINHFKKGQIIKTNKQTIKIINCCRKSKNKYNEWFYEYECLVCGNKDEISHHNLKTGYGCNVCANKKIVRGINDVSTTHPEHVKYFNNIEDAYSYSHSSNKKINLKCPNCNTINTMQISNFINRRFYCPACEDGISIPNKFMFNILKKININFETEKSFNWSMGKKYDFCLPELKIVIEMMGAQHYRYTGRGRSLEEEKDNDKLKKELAFKNNFTYIDIDCSMSELEFMKNNIINSILPKYINFDNIDWINCFLISEKSILIDVCKDWENIKSTLILAEKFKLHRGTITAYLHRGYKLGLCDYNP